MKNKVILITNVSSLVGEAIAGVLAKETAKVVIGLSLLLLSNKTFAQDSLRVDPNKFYKVVAKEFSQTRVLDVQYEVLSSRDFDTEFLGNKLGEKNIKTTQDFKLNVNIPIIKKQRWKLAYSGSYNFQNYNYKNSENTNQKTDFNYFNSSLNFTYFSTLFKKPVIYDARITADASNEMFGRITGTAFATVVLKRKPNSAITVGVIGFIDPTVIIPVLPTFSYSSPLFKGKWNLDVVLPSHVMIRTRLGQKGQISLGTKFGTTRFYFKSNGIVPYANDFEFRQLELKSGIKYEYLLKKKFVLTAKVGLLNVLQSRVSEKGERFNSDNALIDYKPKPTGYFNIGFSFNPF